MMRKMASAVGGKTARACDGCVKKRARWYCVADDAFLCQACDFSVHSSNSLAKRHERVRLKTASSFNASSLADKSIPSWQRDVKRKPRTPRGKLTTPKSEYGSTRNPFSLVPELGVDETTSVCESEEQLVYSRVPVYDPFVAELCTSANSNEEKKFDFDRSVHSDEVNLDYSGVAEPPRSFDIEKLNGFLSSEMDLEEFAADVESLLGKGLENESYGMEGLGLVELVKEEKNEARDAFDMMSFDYDCSAHCGEDDDDDETKTMTMVTATTTTTSFKMLRLDYEGVVSAWDGERCPWSEGIRPKIDPANCWPSCMGSCGLDGHGGRVIGQGVIAAVNAEREARVSRYKEKRRTRLFSKKIRYEVRKLNAEKRPRMKGRFVKRST